MEAGEATVAPEEIQGRSTLATETEPLSKNAQKRLAKAARIAEQKKERRVLEKERRKERKRQLAAKRAAGEISDGEDAPRKKARTEGPKTPFEARIVVDLGFDHMMTENEIKSLTGQLAYTYSANRRASQPFGAILFTGLNGRTYTRLESMSDAAYKRWQDTEWWSEGYEKLWETEGAHPDGKLQKSPQCAARESVVYLTADSSDELTELKEGETYIIGGICDHNRYKNLCFNKAEDSHIRSARLPIGTYLAELRTRKVLTVNQTFEILLKWVETKDWRHAFEHVVPKRKFKDPAEGKAGSNPEDAEEVEGGEPVIVDAAVLEEEEQAEDVDVAEETGIAEPSSSLDAQTEPSSAA